MASIIERCDIPSTFELNVKDRGARILDAGCGDGVFLRGLREAGYSHLYGADLLSPPSGMNRTHYCRIDLARDSIPFDDAYFQAVTAWEVVEHLENPHHFIREAFRVLAPGGHFIISTPNPFHIVSRLLFLRRGNMPRWNRSNNHITLFTKDLFYKAFLKEYFDLDQVRFCRGELTLGFLKHFNGAYPENEWFGHYCLYVMRKKRSLPPRG